MKRVCYNCGKVASTKDHIPPKCLFPKNSQSQLITVPSCAECNEATSLDEQYFLVALTSRRDHGPLQLKVWGQRVLPQLRHEEFEGLRKSLLLHTRWIWLPSPRGFEEAPILNVNMTRVKAVIGKTARGLYYHELGCPLPSTHIVKVYFEPKDWLPALAERTPPPTTIQEGVFSYRYGAADGVSIWWLLYYGQIMAIAVTLAPDVAATKKPTTPAAPARRPSNAALRGPSTTPGSSPAPSTCRPGTDSAS
jgi:hypothetical protein